jgi:hypothetical protein
VRFGTSSKSDDTWSGMRRWISRAGREEQDAIQNLRIQFRPYRLSSRAFLNANPIVISKPVVSRQLPERLATFFVAL